MSHSTEKSNEPISDAEVKQRAQVIVEKFKSTMDPSCTVILAELYDENFDHWQDENYSHVAYGIRQEFQCSLLDAITIAEILFGKKKN